MARNLGDMVVAIKGDSSGLDKSIDKSEKTLDSFSKSIGKVGLALSAGVTTPLVLLGKKFLESSGQFQMYQTSFETMLGSAGKAAAKIQELQKMAAATPFELSDLASAAKTLLQFDIAQEKVIPTLKALGDISQGNGQRFQALSLAFGQASASGKLMGQDLLQMINAGFNPLQEISKKTGESISSLKEKMSAGGISAEMLSDAFVSATAEGGKFFGGMEAASKTLPGLLSTLNDDFMTMGRSFSDNMLPAAMDVVKSLSGMAKWIAELPEPVKSAATSVALFAAALGPTALGVSAVSKAMALFNTALLTNPIGLVIAGAATLTGVMIGLTSAMKSAAEQELFKNTTEQLKQANKEGENVANSIYRIAQETGLTTEKVSELAREAGLVTEEVEAQVDAVVKASEAEDKRKGPLSETLKLNQDIAEAAETTLSAMEDGVIETMSMERVAKALAETFGVSEQKAIGILRQNQGLTAEQKAQLENLGNQLGKIEEMEIAAKRYRQALAGEKFDYLKEQERTFNLSIAAIDKYNKASKKTKEEQLSADNELIKSLKDIGRTDSKEYAAAIARQKARAKSQADEKEFEEARTAAIDKYNTEILANQKLLDAGQITKEEFNEAEKTAIDAVIKELIQLSAQYKDLWGTGNQNLLDGYIGKQKKVVDGLNAIGNTVLQIRAIDIAEQARIDAGLKAVVASNEGAQQEIIDTVIGAANERAASIEHIKNLAIVAEQGITQGLATEVQNRDALLDEQVKSAIEYAETLRGQASLTANTEIAEQARIDQAVKVSVANNDAAMQEIIDISVDAARERVKQEQYVADLALVAEAGITQGLAQQVVSRDALLEESVQNSISLSETLQNQATLTANAEIAEQARIDQAVKISTTNQEGYMAEVVAVAVDGAYEKSKAEKEAAENSGKNWRDFRESERNDAELIAKKQAEYRASQIDDYATIAQAGVSGFNKILDAANSMFTETGDLSATFIGDITSGLGEVVSTFDKEAGTVLQVMGNLQNSLQQALNDFVDSIVGNDERIADAFESANNTLIDLRIEGIEKGLEAELNAIDEATNKRLESLGYIDEVGTDLIQKRYDAELDAIDAREAAELASLGIVEETESDRLQKRIDAINQELTEEISARQRAILEQELAELTSAKTIADVKAGYEAERDAAAKKAAEEKAARDAIELEAAKAKNAAEEAAQIQLRKYNRDKAIADKAISLAQAKIAEQKALADLGWFNWGKKDEVKGLYAQIYSAINAIPLPALAQGGIAMPQSGGQVVNVAEAGVPEAILPLDRLDEVLESVGERSSPTTTGNHWTFYFDSQKLFDEMLPASQNGQIRLSSRAIVNR